MEVPKCRCGEPGHPCYGDKCEDCWVELSPIQGRTPVVHRADKMYAPGTMSMVAAAKRRVHHNKVDRYIVEE